MTKPDSFEPDKIQAGLKNLRIGKKVIVFGSVSSTNDIAAEYTKSESNDGLVVLAEQQQAGRGRGNNKWLSSYGDSIICSVVLTKESISKELLSLTFAVAGAEAISAQAKIKWPNDIFLNGRKIAGILLESKQTGFGTAHVIGIGINCHQKTFPPEINEIATSIDIETKDICDRIIITKRLLSSIEHWLDVARKEPQQVIKTWENLSLLLGQRITVVYNKKRFSGTCSGIDPQKGLILQLDSGRPQFFPAEQTSIAY